MTANTHLMVDLSSNNPLPNLRAYWRAGFRRLGLKATEDTDYTWDQHAALADKWHARGGTVVHYHFARPGDGAEQAVHFIQAVKGHWRPGDYLALDVEVPGVGQQIVADFIDHCAAVWPGRPGLIYSYASFLDGVTPVHGWGLWLAAYGATQPKPAAGWKRLAAWQHTDHATVAGLSRPVDCSTLLDPALLPAAPRKGHPVKVITAVKKYAKAHTALVGAVSTWAVVALQDGKVTTNEWEALGYAVATALGVALVPNKKTT